ANLVDQPPLLLPMPEYKFSRKDGTDSSNAGDQRRWSIGLCSDLFQIRSIGFQKTFEAEFLTRFRIRIRFVLPDSVLGSDIKKRRKDSPLGVEENDVGCVRQKFDDDRHGLQLFARNCR